MSVQRRAHIVQELLEQHIPTPVIPLVFTNPYTLLIATLLSAQCTDERVNNVTRTLFTQATSPHEMLTIPLEELSALIRACGLHMTKARNILTLSQILVEKFDGEVPKSMWALEALPGVGHKTASVVAVQAFQIPAFPVDTHIFRSAHRWGLSHKKTVAGVEEDLKRLYPKGAWGRLHLQMVLYARRFCPARGHEIANCPICSRMHEMRKGSRQHLDNS